MTKKWIDRDFHPGLRLPQPDLGLSSVGPSALFQLARRSPHRESLKEECRMKKGRGALVRGHQRNYGAAPPSQRFGAARRRRCPTRV